MMQPLQVSRKVIGIIGCLVCLLFAAPLLHAQTPMHTFSTGTTSNIYPFASAANNRVQWIYVPSNFTPLMPTGAITKLYFKPSTAATNATFTDLTIKLGMTTLTNLTTGPFVTGLTTVFSATTHVFPAVITNGWLEITLQTPFPYTAGSNLLVEASQSAYVRGFNLNQENTILQTRLYGPLTGTGTQASGRAQIGFDMGAANCSGTPNAGLIITAPRTSPICNTPIAIEASVNNTVTTGLTFQWEQAAAAAGPYANVTGGTGATTLTYTTPPVTANTWYRLKTTCDYSSQSATSTPYAVTVAADTPSAITGSALFCPGGRYVFRITRVTGATAYNWTLPSGWTGTSNTDSIVAIAGPNAGSVSVTVTGPCGTSAPRSFAVTRDVTPVQAGSITGNTTVCSGATQTYSVAAVPGATFYTWTLPPGWTGTSTTSSISVTPGTTAGTISVSAANLCGASTASTLAVAISNQPAAAGTISGSAQVCIAGTETYTVSAIPGALSYNWVLPSGWTGTSTTNTIIVAAGTVGGNIIVRGNNGCGTGTAATYAVTVLPTLSPAVTIASDDTTICAGKPVTFTPTSVNGGANPSYEWRVNGVNVTTGPSFTTSSLATGSSVSVRLNTAYKCPSSPTAQSNTIVIIVKPAAVPGINVNMNAATHICAGTNVTFSTNTVHGGAAPTFQWRQNGSVVGTNAPTYSTTQLGNGDSVFCVMTSNEECVLNPVVNSNRLGLRVTPNVVPAVSISANPGTAIADGQWVTFTASGVNGGATPVYQWTKNGAEIPGAVNATYTTNTLSSGDHIRVRLTSSDRCATPVFAFSGNLVINAGTGISNTLLSLNNFGMAPNPNHGSFAISGQWNSQMHGKEATIHVLNMLGQVVYTRTAEITSGEWKADIQLDNQAAGLYLLQVTADGQKGVKRFEIRK